MKCSTIERILPACPYCGSLDISTRTSRPGGDGSKTAYCNCKTCGDRFNIIWTPPDVSDDVALEALLSYTK